MQKKEIDEAIKLLDSGAFAETARLEKAVADSKASYECAKRGGALGLELGACLAFVRKAEDALAKHLHEVWE